MRQVPIPELVEGRSPERVVGEETYEPGHFCTLARPVARFFDKKKTIDACIHMVYNSYMPHETPQRERRSEQIHIRVTPAEKEMLLDDAQRMHCAVSQYLIWLALREHDRAK